MSIPGPHRAERIVRRLVLLTSMAFAAGCFAIPLGRRTGGPALERKVVVRKRKPNLLQAVDGTWCETDSEKFESVSVGEAVWCVWKQ
jgi:hypothetical protein